jgi:hypothetical protein
MLQHLRLIREFRSQDKQQVDIFKEKMIFSDKKHNATGNAVRFCGSGFRLKSPHDSPVKLSQSTANTFTPD